MDKHILRLLFWETTQKCNLACSHCRMDVEKSYRELDTDQARYLIDSIIDFARPILIFSGGEPLLRSDIFDLAAYAAEKGLHTALASNGTLIDQSVANNIKLAGIKRVSVSIDGSDAKTHDVFRNSEGSFDKALQGVSVLIENNISAQINATITRDNVDQLEDMIRLAIKYKTDAIHLFLVVPVGCGKYLEESKLLNPLEYEKTLKYINKLSEQYKEEIFIKVTCAPQYYRILKQEHPESFDSKATSMHRISKGCLAGTGVCFVSSTGDVYPCGYLPVTAGNILQAPLKDIWSGSEIFQRLRTEELIGENCRSCSYLSACGGCRARAYFSTDLNYMAADPNCILNT